MLGAVTLEPADNVVLAMVPPIPAGVFTGACIIMPSARFSDAPLNAALNPVKPELRRLPAMLRQLR